MILPKMYISIALHRTDKSFRAGPAVSVHLSGILFSPLNMII